jgi:hypothetical protein
MWRGARGKGLRSLFRVRRVLARIRLRLDGLLSSGASLRVRAQIPGSRRCAGTGGGAWRHPVRRGRVLARWLLGLVGRVCRLIRHWLKRLVVLRIAALRQSHSGDRKGQRAAKNKRYYLRSHVSSFPAIPCPRLANINPGRQFWFAAARQVIVTKTGISRDLAALYALQQRRLFPAPCSGPLGSMIAPRLYD